MENKENRLETTDVIRSDISRELDGYTIQAGIIFLKNILKETADKKYSSIIFDKDIEHDYEGPADVLRVLGRRPMTDEEIAKKKLAEEKQREWKLNQYKQLQRELGLEKENE